MNDMQLIVETTNSENHMHVTRRQLKDDQDAKQQYEAEKSVNRDILGQELKEKLPNSVMLNVMLLLNQWMCLLSIKFLF